MNSTTDIELMQQLRKGSEAALRELIERHRERLFRLASTWLCTICARRCYDELRRRQRHRKTLSEMPAEDIQSDDLAADELLTLLHRTIATLPPKQRVVYQLREIECLSTDEVVSATRMSADQVKANLFVARNTVREKLKQYGI